MQLGEAFILSLTVTVMKSDYNHIFTAVSRRKSEGDEKTKDNGEFTAMEPVRPPNELRPIIPRE